MSPKPAQTALAGLLAKLQAEAGARGWSAQELARRAGVRAETLSRLRRRGDCDYRTLAALAAATGYRLELARQDPTSTQPDCTNAAHGPLDRDREERLLALCARERLDERAWRREGTGYFMAGLAMLLACTRHFRRDELVGFAERLHPNISSPAVFAGWVATSPLRPARFLPMLSARRRHAA